MPRSLICKHSRLVSQQLAVLPSQLAHFGPLDLLNRSSSHWLLKRSWKMWMRCQLRHGNRHCQLRQVRWLCRMAQKQRMMASGLSFEEWMSLGSLQSLTRFCGKVVNSNCCASVHLGCHSLIGLECLWCPLLLPVQTHQLNEFICAHAKEGSHPKVPAWFLMDELLWALFGKMPEVGVYGFLSVEAMACFQNGIEEPSWYPFQKWVCMVPSLLIIKKQKCCASNGVLSKRNWGTIVIPIIPEVGEYGSLSLDYKKNVVQAMVCFQNGIEEPSIMIPISWYGNFPIMIAINRDAHAFNACQLKQLQLNCLFKVRVLYSTVLENMSIQWKTCQGWTSRFIFVDMLTNCLWF